MNAYLDATGQSGQHPCFCSCHEYPGTYFCEPCSTCGHYHSRGTVQGYRKGWLANGTPDSELHELYEYLRQFESITGASGTLLERVRAVIVHYATQAGRMQNRTGGWEPRGKR